MTALEWLNLLAYRHDKSEAERAEMELWKKTH